MGNRQEWKTEELEFIKNNYTKMTNNELGKALGRTQSSIHMKLGRLNLVRPDKYNYNKEFFKYIDTEEKSYWLGFIYADGYVWQTPNNSELGIELNINDKKHLQKFNKSIEGNIEVSERSRLHKDWGKVYDTCLIRLYNKNIVDDLINLGVIQNKSETIEIPDIPKEFMPHFLRGYFDGDGCVCLNKQRQCHQFDYCGVSLKMLEQIRVFLFEECGINSYISKEPDSERSTIQCYRLYIKGMGNAYKFGLFLYKDANMYLDRKKIIFNNITINNNIIERINKIK